jgi:hypothetical protein
MSMKSIAMAGLSSILLVAGCGSSSDDSKPAAAQGTPNKQGASSATQTTIGAVQTAIKPAAGTADAGQSSANQLSSAAQATQNLVTPSAATAKSLPGLELADLLRPLGNPTTGTTGTCTCTADSCTFAACALGGVTIDGTYAFGGGHIKTTDLKYTITLATGGVAADVVIDVEADITATATSINGSFHSKGTTTASASGQSYSSTWDSTLDFKSVTFAAGGGAPTGGSEHVSSTTNVTSGGASQAYTADFDVTFPSN